MVSNEQCGTCTSLVQQTYEHSLQGNCLGTRKKSDQGGYRLGSASQQQQTSPSQGHTLGGGGGGGSNSSASNNREAMLAAAEQRRLQVCYLLLG